VRGAMPGGLVFRSPAPLRSKPFASRGQISSGRSLGWPFAGGVPGGDWAALLAGGSLAAALIKCATVALGAGGGVSAAGSRARLRLTT